MESLVITSPQSGKDVTTSLKIAEVFGKRHDNVVRDIKELSCSPQFNALNFEESSYTNAQNKQLPMFQITKDGFAFLVMGYTGEKAAQFKEQFIAEFNNREAMLKSDEYILMRSQEILQRKMNALQESLQKKEVQIELQEGIIKQQAPKVEYHDTVLQAQGTILSNVIAKEMGMSARTLNKILHDKKVIYKQGDTWVLYQRYQNEGLAKTKTFPYLASDGTTKTNIQLVWTEKGRKFIHDICTEVKV